MAATPSYQGTSQPTDNGGWLGRLGSFFGGGTTPAYLGDGQPSPGTASSFLTVATPMYRPAPVVKPTENQGDMASAASSPAQAGEAAHAYACTMDPDPFGSGPIAIVIPRQG